jgi:superfamily II DNA or RNA helicase
MRSLIPGIRIGRFQGDKMEVEPDKYDCTICMIQTIVKRQIPESVLRSYKFTIFDECHHLGAQHFSKVLQRVQTKHMLGLSATPTREDGLSKVFTWFLGEPVYWEKTREPDPTVEVKGVFIQTTDEIYNTVPMDWRGEPVMARLLGNILGCSDRNKEILRWILRIAGPDRKILILSERIGHLNGIEAMVKEANPALTMSYYIGGMKEEEREEGAAKSMILLASYAMASEAMNIKTLNCVVMATSRKKIEQSTGRILRQRPEERKVAPLIVDIIDVHRSYQSQARERIAYYKKCGYKILDSDASEEAMKKKDGPITYGFVDDE